MSTATAAAPFPANGMAVGGNAAIVTGGEAAITGKGTLVDSADRPPACRSWLRRILPLGVLAVVAALVFGGIDVVSGGPAGWTDAALDVVGNPVDAGPRVLVVDVSSRHQLELSAVNASDGLVAWARPFSASEITPGIPLAPTVLGQTALVLSPTGRSSDLSVLVRGVDVSTGKVLWSLPEPLIVSDAPTICPDGKNFCLATFTSDTTTTLIILAPTTGHVVSAIQGPNRAMAAAPPDGTSQGDLWQTNDQSPTLMQVSSAGSAVWTKPVSELFGGSQYNPDNGWVFLEKGPLIVGSVGMAPTGQSLPLGTFKTIGISAADGTVTWSLPGFYLCGGGLTFLTADVICKYRGTARVRKGSVSMSAVALTLEGLDSKTGTTTWSAKVLDPQTLSLGTNVAFADATHLVIRLSSGKQVVLDVKTGTSRPVAAGDTFWCEQQPMYNITSSSGTSGGERSSAPVFQACSASGTPVTTLPRTTPASVGVKSGGLFVWPTPHGLRAAPFPG